MRWKVLVMTAVLCSVAATAHAGAWTLGQWKSYHKLAVAYFESDQEFNDNGHVVDSALTKQYHDTNYSYFCELGLLNRLDVIGQFLYKRATSEDDERRLKYAGPADLDIGLKYKWLDKKVVGAAQFLYKYPYLYDEDRDKLPPGQGQNDYEGRLMFGMSFYPIPLYAGLEGGYRLRAGAPSDEWRYLGEVGATIWRFAPRVKLDGTASVGNADDGRSAQVTTGLEYAIGKLETALDFRVTKFFYLEAAYTNTLYGRNTATGNTYTGAAVFTF